MFDRYKIKKRYMAATNEIIKPELKGCRSIFEDSALHTPTMKRHIGSVLRLAACMVLVITLVGVIVFQNSGGFTTKTTSVQNGMSAQGTTTKDSFTLVAYAASPNAASSTVDSIATQSDVDKTTGTVLQPNEKITLPVGKIEKIPGINDPESVAYVDSQGVKRYMLYMLQYTSGFKFEGNNIETIEMSATGHNIVAKDQSQIQKLYAENPDTSKWTDSERSLFQSYVKSGDSITFTPECTAYWTPGPSEWDVIDKSSNFTDYSSVPNDTITIKIDFTDGTVQTRTVTMAFNDDGSISSVLSGN